MAKGDKEKLDKVFEAIKQLDETDRSWLMGYLGVCDPDIKRLKEKIEAYRKTQ